MNPTGELTQPRLENDRLQIQQFVAQVPAPVRVAIEASGMGWWLVALPEELGHQPIRSHPKQTRAIAAAWLKNDRVDAERLVQLLRGNRRPTVWIPPMAVRAARERLRHPGHLVWKRTGVSPDYTLDLGPSD